MRRTIIGSLILFVLVMVTLVFKATANKDNDKTKKNKVKQVEWHSFDKGFDLAQKENKLLVVDFYTDWCHWCKVMDKETYASDQVIKFASKNVIMAKINAETDNKFKFKDASYSGRELSMMFGVRGFPTTVFINSNGDLITSVSGFIPADKFTLILKYLAGNWYEKMKFDEFEKKEKSKS